MLHDGYWIRMDVQKMIEKGIELRNTGDLAGSQEALEDAVRAGINHQGKEGHDTLCAKSQLGKTHRVLGNYSAAVALHREVLDIRFQLFHVLHDYTLNSAVILAETLYLAGQQAESQKLIQSIAGSIQSIREAASAAGKDYSGFDVVIPLKGALENKGEDAAFCDSMRALLEKSTLHMEAALFEPIHIIDIHKGKEVRRDPGMLAG